jgi:hypothetical protein
LRFASFAVINLRWDFHPQECARAGRTKQTGRPALPGGPFAYFRLSPADEGIGLHGKNHTAAAGATFLVSFSLIRADLPERSRR